MIRIIPFAVVSVLGVVSHCAPIIAQDKLKDDPSQEEHATPLLNVGDLAPALKVTKWLQGDAVRKFESGKVYVIEFWATWCGPCVANMPHLAQLQARYKNQGVTIIAFTSRDIRGVPNNGEKQVTEFVQKRGPKLKYTFAYADDGTTADAWMMGQRYFCTFVVNKGGNIAYIGHPMFLDLVLPKVLDGDTEAKVVGDEMAEVVAEYETMYGSLVRDPKVGLPALKEFELKYPPLADLFPVVRAKLSLLPKHGNPDDAKAYAEALLAKASEQKDSRLLELVYSVLRNERENNELLALAVLAAEANVRIDGGKDAQSLLNLADAHLVNGDPAKAKEYARKAIDAAAGESPALQRYIEKEALKLGAEK